MKSMAPHRLVGKHLNQCDRPRVVNTLLNSADMTSVDNNQHLDLETFPLATGALSSVLWIPTLIPAAGARCWWITRPVASFQRSLKSRRVEKPTTTRNFIIVLRSQTRHNLSFHTRPLPFLTNALFFFVPFHRDITCPASALKIPILEKEKNKSHTPITIDEVQKTFTFTTFTETTKPSSPHAEGRPQDFSLAPSQRPRGAAVTAPAGGALTKPGAGRSCR